MKKLVCTVLISIAFSSRLSLAQPAPSTDSKTYTDQGRDHMSRREYDLAIDDFTRDLRVRPDDLVDLLDRGWCYMAAGAKDLATLDFKRAIAVHANEGNTNIAYYDLGVIHYSDGLYRDAVADFTSSIAIIESEPRLGYASAARECRALAYYRLGDQTNAKSDCEKVLSEHVLAPDWDRFLLLGLASAISGDTQKALGCCRKALLSCSTYARIYELMGDIYWQDGKTDSAVTVWIKAGKMDPENASLMFPLAREVVDSALAVPQVQTQRTPAAGRPVLVSLPLLSADNGDQVLTGGERAYLTVKVTNLGNGDAKGVAVKLSGTSKVLQYLGTSYSLGDIPAGQSRDALFEAVLPNRVESDNGSIIIHVSEANMFDALEEKELIVAMQPAKVTRETQVVSTLVDVDGDIPETGASNPDAVAVVIGEGDYGNVPKVEYAQRDASVVRDYLIKVFGYADRNVIVLSNPTLADLIGVFGNKGNPQGRLYNYVRKNESDVFVYYIGHGAPDLKTKQAFLVPADADPSYINLQGYPLSTLYENLAQIPAKSMTVVLDACFSGAYDKGLIIQQASPLVVVAAPEIGKLPDNMTLMTSAGASEVSSWYADKKHSLFTYWFLKGLQGEADANKDKSITVGEMKKYVSENVSYWAQRLHNRIQTPTFSGDDSRVLARFR